MQSFGKNTYKYLRDTNALVKTFYYNKANDSKNILLNLPNQDTLNTDITNRAKDVNETDDYIDNFSAQFDFKLSKDKAVAQAVLNYVPKIKFKIVEELSNTDRGQGGFGSSGRGL